MLHTKRALALITLLLGSPMPALARDAAKDNATLLRASSPFEDMVEFALDNKDAGIEKALRAADDTAAAVRDALSETSAAQFDSMLKGLHTAARAKQHHAVAAGAVETLRLLIENLDASSLEVPKEVGLLDYVGFRLHVLAAAPQPDWDAMRRTVEEASKWWAAIKPKVTDKGLRDAFSSTVRGLQEATKVEHLPMLNFAAQIDLDLVDLLEGHFEHKK